MGTHTISVASTRVPTIFSRTFVFFSMICEAIRTRVRMCKRIRACSSDAKEGGLEFGSNRMSGWMSFTASQTSLHECI